MLKIQNLSKSFGSSNILKNINLEINDKETSVIIGPSGSGKSTLLRCINMLDPPTSGQIFMDNEEITNDKVPLNILRQKIGMVFQQFNLFPHLTVLENITLAPIKLKIMTKEEANKKAKELLDLIELEDKSDNYPEELSGGQKQRVAIVRSLIMNPDIILFDEPTSALDPEMTLEVLELIKNIADNGMTMVIVSHEMNFVRKCANKVIFIDDGKISFYGTAKEAFSNRDNERLKDFLLKTNK